MASAQNKALALSLFTVGYNILEGVVAIVGATMAGSSVLLAFGLDSFVESLSGSVMIWRFWKFGPKADEDKIAGAEKKATRLVGYTFFILGAYVVFDSTRALVTHEAPSKSINGLAIGIAAVIVMPALL